MAQMEGSAAVSGGNVTWRLERGPDGSTPTKTALQDVMASRLLAGLEFEHGLAARDGGRHQRAEVFRARPFVEQTVPDEGDKVAELAMTQMNRRPKPLIELRQDRFDRSESMGKVTDRRRPRPDCNYGPTVRHPNGDGSRLRAS